MRKRDIESLKKALLKQRQALVKENPRTGSDAVPLQGDSADIAALDREQQLGLSLRERTRNMRKLIDDALERIEDGEYGLCLACGEEIPLGRLRIRPVAARCVPCKEKDERGGRPSAEEADLLSRDIDPRDFQGDKE